MIQPLLKERIQPAIRRIQIRRMFLAVATVLLLCGLVTIAILLYAQSNEVALSDFWLPLGGITVLLAFIGGLWGWISGRNLQAAVEKIESTFPDLDSALVTACEQFPAPGERTLSFLQQDVVRRAVYHSYDHKWSNVVRFGQLLTAPVVAGVSLLAFAAALFALTYYQPKVDPNSVAFDDVKIRSATNFEFSVEPGNAEVEKGTSLLVLARFTDSIPAEATIVCETSDGQQKQIGMKKSLDDPVFGARIPEIENALKYQVIFGENQSESFDVDVFEFPELIRSDAEIEFPDYTKQAPKRIEDVRRISAVQGSQAELKLHLNKPVKDAVLISDFGFRIELEVSAENANTFVAKVPFHSPGRRSFRLQLKDSEDRVNKEPPRFVINTLENKAPDLKLLSPANDMQVSALEEIEVQAKSFDDFGIQKFGLSYTLGDAEESEVTFTTEESKKQTIEHLLSLEELQAAADQFLTYYVWAEDVGPDGQPRRVRSDVFFAEVRPFDEIYRQADAPPSGGQQQQQQNQGQNGQNAQAAQQLAELQKQIITATWNLIRREIAEEPTEDFVDDVQVVAESQQQALAQLEELAGQLQDGQSSGIADEVRSLMNGATVDFQSEKVESLEPAFQKAKGAYQGLLKLRSREHQVQRQQQQQQSQQSQNQSRQQQQQQLNQLNLEKDENPYKQEQQAQQQSEKEQVQKEERQILSRLRELAQRQNDLNKRIKELQSALEEAQTEEEKDEIERELERLREEQQKILRDAEELQERMEQASNQEEMEEPSQQMEEARENARRAADALDKGEVTKAAAEGQRTKEQLEELRDEFQNRTSGQFNEQMREMRNEARELEEKQNELQDRLADVESGPEQSTSLRSNEDSTEQIAEDLAEQRERIERLRQEMKDTIEEAEEYEPLLADQLYDSYRESEQQRLEDTLQSAERSLKRGLLDDARMEEDIANQGIQNLREGIEQAAESVLGDESKALETARKTVEQLRRELENEIDENNPDQTRQRDADGSPRESDQEAKPSQSDKSGDMQSEGQSKAENESESNESQGQGIQSQQNQESSEQASENQQESNSQSGTGQNESERNENQQNAEGEQGQPGDSQANQNQQGGRQNARPQQGGLRDGREQRQLGPPPLTNQGREADPNLNDRDAAPLTGEEFLDWADRLRDVEEMVNDPDLRAEASRIREKAKEIRKDYKRHSKDPNWELVEMEIAKPLRELQKRLTQELIRRSNRNAVIPLDRDPVPRRFQNAVENYYRELGTGQ